MRIRLSSILVVLLTFSSFNSINSQTTSQQQHQEEPVVRIRANEVTLDIVVRDKKGRPVRDLTPADFEIYEDGVRQQIGSFRFVLRQPTEAGNATVPTPGGKPVTAPRVPAPRDVGS